MVILLSQNAQTNLTDIRCLCGKKPNLLILSKNNTSVNSYYIIVLSTDYERHIIESNYRWAMYKYEQPATTRIGLSYLHI